MLAITLLHIMVDIPALICEYFYVDKVNEDFLTRVLTSVKVHNHCTTRICSDEIDFVGN